MLAQGNESVEIPQPQPQPLLNDITMDIEVLNNIKIDKLNKYC